MATGVDDWIGLRVARYRDLAGMTQRELADRVGVTQPYISQLENGTRAVATRALLIALAEALGVATTDLTATPPAARSEPERVVHEVVPYVRAALDGAEDVEPVPVAQLAADVDAMMRARMACDYPALARLLAPVLARTLALAETEDGPALGLFARACVTEALALRPLGYVDLATRLAERGQWAAAQADDLSAQAAAEYARAQSSLSGGVRGLRARSLTLATRAADTLQGHDGDEARSWYVMLHLQAGLAAATLGRDDDAMAHIDEAAEVVARVGSDPWRMDVNASNVGVWRVAAALEGGDPGRAPEYARRIDTTKLRTVQRRAHLLTHTAHALYLSGDHEAATRAFLEADRVAEAEVRGRPRVREIVGQMVRDARRRAGSEELRDLARKVGVDPLAE